MHLAKIMMQSCGDLRRFLLNSLIFMLYVETAFGLIASFLIGHAIFLLINHYYLFHSSGSWKLKIS